MTRPFDSGWLLIILFLLSFFVLIIYDQYAVHVMNSTSYCALARTNNFDNRMQYNKLELEPKMMHRSF